MADARNDGIAACLGKITSPPSESNHMATALRIDPQPACEHRAFNGSYETIGGGPLDPVVLDRGKCCSCQEWLERETDLMTNTVTFRPLDAATILRLIREQEQDDEAFV